MNPQTMMRSKTFMAAAAILALTLSPLAAKKAVNNDAKFREKLASDKQIEQALNRLTFGARPEDASAVKKLGLKKWIAKQLNPASIPENAVLEATISKMGTLGLSSEAMAIQYPTPQVLTAVATGKMPMPEDPALRETYERLSERYKARIERKKTKGEEDEEEVKKAAEDRIRRRIGVEF